MPAGAARSRAGRLSPASTIARAPADQRRDQCLRQLQPNELAREAPIARRTREVAVAGLGPHQEQVRHVGAGDQQDDAGGREQDPERPRRRAQHLVEQRAHDRAVLARSAGRSPASRRSAPAAGAPGP